MCADCPARLARDLDTAFPDFLAHHQDLVFSVALRVTGRQADAEDLAQETFVRAFRALRTYDASRIRELRTRGWLAAIALNQGRNRSRRRHPGTVGLDATTAVAAEARLQPEAVVEERESAAEWRARLGALPARYRLAVELRHVAGLPYPEVALAMGRPVGTVKSDVHRGVRMLREAWLAQAGPGASSVTPGQEGST